MSNNSKAKGAGLITFKPEIRRESIRAIIYMTIYLVSTYLMIGPLGIWYGIVKCNSIKPE